MPSVLFFLATVVPSIWILSLDEASRKNKFTQVADTQENKIKSFVLSLDDMINMPKTSLTTEITVASLVNSSASAKVARSLTNDDDSYESSNTLTKTLTSTVSSALANIKKPKSKTSLAEAKKFLQKNVECCDVKVSYWFLEDNLQHLFLQSLMVILIASRWLITRAELNLNQRSLILVISIAVSADICDFFNYLSLELIYSTPYLTHTLLLIISLSLVQFIFLHVEDSLNLTRSFSSSFNSSTENNNNNNNNANTESDTNSSSNGGVPNDFVDTDDILKKKRSKQACVIKNILL